MAENPIPPKNKFTPEYVRDPSIEEIKIEYLNNMDDRTPEQQKEDENTEDELYSIKNFSV